MNNSDKEFWVARFIDLEDVLRRRFNGIEKQLDQLVKLKKKEVYGLDYYDSSDYTWNQEKTVGVDQ